MKYNDKLLEPATSITLLISSHLVDEIKFGEFIVPHQELIPQQKLLCTTEVKGFFSRKLFCPNWRKWAVNSSTFANRLSLPVPPASLVQYEVGEATHWHGYTPRVRKGKWWEGNTRQVYHPILYGNAQTQACWRSRSEMEIDRIEWEWQHLVHKGPPNVSVSTRHGPWFHDYMEYNII